ncbi:MAG TPA: hypothetical protein VMW83_17105 [Spirochaetia bacterium]|nr:hypothetical protein [Spirochaetia bacterium]
MRSYGIFDGVAREDHLVAAAVYFPEDFAAFYGSKEDYQDYLLERHNFLEDLYLDEAVRIVHVPFDPADYRTWLKSHGNWTEGPEARSAWAMARAADEDALNILKKKHSFLPAAPTGEELVVSVFFGVVPVLLAVKDDLTRIGKRLDSGRLTRITDAFLQQLPGAPAFKRLSALRCGGMRVFVGDRLTHPVHIDDVETALEKQASQVLEQPENILAVPRPYSLSRPDFALEQDAVIFTPALLPLVLVGADDSVNYTENLLESVHGELAAVSDQVVSSIGALKLSVEITGSIPFVPGYEVYDLLEYMYQNLEEQADREQVAVRKIKRSKSWLKRIK